MKSNRLRLLLLLYLMLPAFGGHTLPQQYVIQEEKVTAPSDTLSQWETLQMAIAFTESRFNPEARGKANDLGVFQITPIYVKEINRLSGDEVFAHEDATDLTMSVEMFNAMQDYKNPEHDIHLAIYYHNKSKAYEQTVRRNIELINRYEELRKVLRDAR